MVKLDQQLTQHFSLKEFIKSATAEKNNIENIPKPQHIHNMRKLCQYVLEPLREVFGPITITSGFRSPYLNIAVGGTFLSQHTKGEAADIRIGTSERGKRMFQWIKDNLLFDQLIFERSTQTGAIWLHVSFKSDKKLNRKDAKTIVI